MTAKKIGKIWDGQLSLFEWAQKVNKESPMTSSTFSSDLQSEEENSSGGASETLKVANTEQNSVNMANVEEETENNINDDHFEGKIDRRIGEVLGQSRFDKYHLNYSLEQLLEEFKVLPSEEQVKRCHKSILWPEPDWKIIHKEGTFTAEELYHLKNFYDAFPDNPAITAQKQKTRTGLSLEKGLEAYIAGLLYFRDHFLDKDIAAALIKQAHLCIRIEQPRQLLRVPGLNKIFSSNFLPEKAKYSSTDCFDSIFSAANSRKLFDLFNNGQKWESAELNVLVKGFPDKWEPWMDQCYILPVSSSGQETDGYIIVNKNKLYGPDGRIFAPTSKLASYLEDRYSTSRLVEWTLRNNENQNLFFKNRLLLAEYFQSHFQSSLVTQKEKKVEKTEIDTEKEEKKKSLTPKRPVAPQPYRKGPEYRGDRNVSPEEFQKTFNFPGMEFGEWVPNHDRIAYLNLAYDAFMDIARVLDIPPSAVSCNGQLAIAFGSRGYGKAFAHLEMHVGEKKSLQGVINLTKTSGGGCLAHEFGHALDYFALYNNSEPTSVDDSTLNHVTSPLLKHRLKDEKDCMEMMSKAKANMEKDFEIVKNQLGTEGNTVIDKGKEAGLELREEAGIIMGRFNKMSTMIQNGQAESVLDIYSRNGWKDIYKDFTKLTNNGRGYFFNLSKPGLNPDTVAQFSTYDYRGYNCLVKTENALRRYIHEASVFRHEQEILKTLPANKDLRTVTMKTDFYNGAQTLDKNRKDYWATDKEMYARAFEAYIQNELKEEGAHSHYLVYGTQPNDYPELLTSGASAYPLDGEQQHIFDAIKQSVEYAKERSPWLQGGFSAPVLPTQADNMESVTIETGKKHRHQTF